MSADNQQHVRKLVTVRRISRIEKDKKRKLKFAHVDGWTVYVGPKRWQAGDLVVFFEIDSFLPKSDGRYWELIAYDKTVFRGQEGYRVKSRRIGGNKVSPGLIFRLTDFPEIKEVWDKTVAALGEEEGAKAAMAMSFEDVLGVKKYIAELDGDTPFASLGPPPCFIHQPAWERAQNIASLFSPATRAAATTYQITEKLNGWSMSVYWVRRDSRWRQRLTEIPPACKGVMEPEGGRRVGVCTRNQDWLANEGNPLWKVALEMDLPGKVRRIGGDVAVQGEFVGSSVMANTMGFAEGEHTFRVFAIWDIERQTYLSVAETMEICERLDLPHTPVVRCCRLDEFASDLEDLVRKADGVGMNERIREGLVFKTMDGQRQFKVISNQWLIQRGE
ncbi:RNA ligase-domain-containing protein [Coniochaeta sp. 2T2.1]|nr:RNA ligase-domain-containing protein [Coniochaeta sp. 2T2.1]